MLLVEEYLGIELPDAEGLLPPAPSETVEMPEEALDDDDFEDDFEDEDTDEQELVLGARAGRRLQVALPVSKPKPAPSSAQIHTLPPRSSVSLSAPRIAAAPRGFSASEPIAAAAAPDPLGAPEPRALRRYAFDDPSDIPEPLVAHGASPEPLRLALPTNAEEEASLVLAAAAPEDYDDDEDWDDDDLWDEDDDSLDDIPGASLRLTLDNDTMEDLRNLEERRSFAEPIWGPRPASDRFDSDISLFDESDEDDSAVFDREETAQRAQSALVFEGADDGDMDAFAFDEEVEDDDGSGAFPRVASIRIGGDRPEPPGADVPEPLVQISAPPVREVVRWDDESTDNVTARSLVSPESNPVQSYSIVPDEEPVRPEDQPLLEVEQPRRTRRPPPEEDERGSPIIWLVAISILIGVGGSAIYVLVKDLAVAPPAFGELLQRGNNTETTPPPEPGPDATAPAPEPVDPDATAPEAAPPPDEPDASGPDATEPQVGIGLPTEGLGTLEERLDPTMGRLRIISDRKSRVYIDNKRIGTTPIDNLSLAAGVYDVKLVALTSGRSQMVRARVDAGKVLQVELNFE